MKAIIELIGYKDGVRQVRYWDVSLYSGIVADYIEKYEKSGWTDISARII